MRRTGATMVITLCGAPDWMKGGKPGETDWSRLEAAPLPERFGDFARLAVQVAKRYPDVRHFQVWNEFKGFYNAKANRWDYEGYTRMYNAVHDKLKAHDPGLKIGGPYITMNSYRDPDAGGFPSDLRGPWGIMDRRSLDAIDYWLAHRHGADFICIDGGWDNRDGDVAPPQLAAQKFAAANRWIRQRTELPIWWSEFYIGLRPGSAASTPEALRTALTTMWDTGASVALLWGPEAAEGFAHPCLWTSTREAGGGRSTEYLSVVQCFSNRRPHR